MISNSPATLERFSRPFKIYAPICSSFNMLSIIPRQHFWMCWISFNGQSLGSNPQNLLENSKGMFVINRVLLVEAKIYIKITISTILSTLKIGKICFSPKVSIQPFLEPFEHNLGQKSSIKRLFQPTVGPISALGPNQLDCIGPDLREPN